MPDDPRASTWPYLDHPLPIAFAHRGGVHHPDIVGLENTLAAFRHAVGLGYSFLETDVHVTADGVLLAFHDEVLDRVTDRTGAIAESTLAQVRQATIGGREPVPTLDELVEAFPDARFNIDIKSAGAVPALAAYVEERGLHDRVLVGSFSASRLRRFRRLTAGRVATSAREPGGQDDPGDHLARVRRGGHPARGEAAEAAHPGEVVAWVVLPAWLARRVAGRVAALQIPHRSGPLTVAGRRLVRRAHRAGVQVHVWTIDTAEEINQLLDRGVDGIFTDRTDILRDVLRSRGQWRETR